MEGGSVHGIPGVLACCEALNPLQKYHPMRLARGWRTLDQTAMGCKASDGQTAKRQNVKAYQ